MLNSTNTQVMRIKLLFLFLCFAIGIIGQTTDNYFPESTNEAAEAQEDASPTMYQAQLVINHHTVVKGENIASIAKAYNVEVEDIKRWNELNSNKLATGTELVIKIISFSPIEESPQSELADPELIIIHVDENTNSNIMSNYVGKINKEFAVEKEYYRIDAAVQQIIYYAENTITEEKSTEQKPAAKKNLWNRVTHAAKNTFASVKNWGGNMIGKLKSGKEPELMLAENKETSSSIMELEKAVETEVESQDSIQSEDTEEVYPQQDADKYKKVYHKVRFGETLTQIASRYHVSKEDIVSWNKLPSNIAKVRQRLLIYIPKGYTIAAVNN